MSNDPKFRKYASLLGLGAEIAVALSAPILAGYWLDQRFNTFPWLLISGIFVGMILLMAIFMRLIRETK